MTDGTEGKTLAAHIVRMLNALAGALDGISTEQANQSPPFSPSNTLYQLVVHVTGSTRYWVITNTGGTDFHRDRPAEFVASGDLAEALSDFRRMSAQVNDHLGALTANDLARPPALATSRFGGWVGDDPPRQRDGVLHALDHVSLHFGHIQIQRQLLGLEPVN
jgi:hypothetical protein